MTPLLPQTVPSAHQGAIYCLNASTTLWGIRMPSHVRLPVPPPPNQGYNVRGGGTPPPPPPFRACML